MDQGVKDGGGASQNREPSSLPALPASSSPEPPDVRIHRDERVAFEHDHLAPSPSNAAAHAEAQSQPETRLLEADLPQLPSDAEDDDDDDDGLMATAEDSSALRSDGDLDSSAANEDSALVERDMRQKLMDIESSFIPDQPPPSSEDAQEDAPKGVDDTYLFGGSPGNGSERREEAEPSSEANVDSSLLERTEDLEDMSTATPSDAYKTPAPFREDAREEEQEDGGRDNSVLDAGTSSPLAAAAQRSHARAASAGLYSQSAAGEDSRPQTAQQYTPESTQLAETSPTTTIRPQDSAPPATHIKTQPAESSELPLTDDVTLSPRSDTSSAPTHRDIRRPNSMHSRQLSQLSAVSASSHQSEYSLDGGGSGDATDYAVASGGAAPTSNGLLGRSLSNTNSISRLPSISSINSAFSDFNENGNERPRPSTRPSALAPLDELGEPATPRPGSGWTGLNNNNNNPTDTVITQHVKNIRVPDTVAREYLRTHRHPSANPSPEKRASGVSLSSRASSKSSLTLKEQNSKIDKLSKENFDLKLKIHFLDQALQNRSDEGVKDMISKNVQLQTDLANEKKESQGLRRKVRDLERKIKGFEEGQNATQKKETAESDEDGSGGSRYFELEEEITYLRECLQHSESQVDKLREDTMARELERRKLAEHIKNLSDNQQRRAAEDEPATGVEEAMEMWKDLLEAETARREQADEDAQRARDEAKAAKQQMAQMQAQMATMRPGSSGGTNTTTNHIRNTYHINKRQQYSYNNAPPHGGDDVRSSDGVSAPGGFPMDQQATFSNGIGGAVRPGTSAGDSNSLATSATLVEQLKHENAELRRDLGAQTSMLTSRNRERERLQQEIEDLKLHARRGGADRLGSVAGDSIFERSVSRAGQQNHHGAAAHGHGRSASRMSGGTGMTRATQDDEFVPLAQFEKEREDWERQLNATKDELYQQKMLYQDLERESNGILDDIEKHDKTIAQLRQEKTGFLEDLKELSAERDELLLALEDKENELKDLREEAEGLIAELEDKVQAGEEEAGRAMTDLDARNEDFSVLQGEMRTVSEKLVGLEDDMAGKRRRIQVLEGEAKGYEQEIEELDKRVRDLSGKNERLEIQLESTQGEISFLREEQESDKIKIGELEASLAGAQQDYQEERDRLEEERRQREILDSEEKSEVQKMMDEINSQLSKARDEVKRLRKNLSSKEVEATTWKERLETLEGGLKDALGDINGTRSTFLKDIQELQKSLDSTLHELDGARAELAEKKHVLNQHNSLLESASLESHKLADMLERERTAHRQARAQIDNVSRQHQMVSRTVQAHESKALELETQRGVDKRRIAQLEDRFREQLMDRNNLLLALWHRLSTLCGPEWAQKHTLVDGHVPSIAVLEKNLPGFNKNVIQAVKEVEGIVGGFRSRIRSIEKDLWKDFQTLEHSLDQRLKKLDHLERVVAEQDVELLSPNPSGRRSSRRSASRAGSDRSADGSDYQRLKSQNKMLRQELQLQRGLASPTAPSTRAASIAESTNFDALRSPTRSGTRDGSGAPPTLQRGYTTSAMDHFAQHPNSYAQTALNPIPDAADSPTISRTHSAKRSASRHGSHGQNVQQASGGGGGGGGGVSAPLQPSEARWIHRLKELERRLKAEREARLLDRSGARKRLEQGQRENEELRERLEREKVLRGGAGGGGSGGGSSGLDASADNDVD